VVNLVANGMTIEEILMEYPDLEAEDIKQACNTQRSSPVRKSIP